MDDAEDIADMIAHQHWASGPRELSSYPQVGPFVYFIQCGAFIKIGMSINPESRCAQLERGGKALRPSIWVGDPQLIAYAVGNVNKERMLHKEFAHLRDLGEWFLMDEDLIEHVNDIQQQQCLTELQVHTARYDSKVAAGEWPAVSYDAAEQYASHVESKNQIDLEWLEAFAA